MKFNKACLQKLLRYMEYKYRNKTYVFQSTLLTVLLHFLILFLMFEKKYFRVVQNILF